MEGGDAKDTLRGLVDSGFFVITALGKVASILRASCNVHQQNSAALMPLRLPETRAFQAPIS